MFFPQLVDRLEAAYAFGEKKCSYAWRNISLFATIVISLFQSEDKIKPKTNDITGSLLALEYAVKQEYFPKKLALYFIAFLSK